MKYRFGLIGYPIKHSLSPWIHQQFLEKSHLTGTYELIEITPKNNFSNKMDMLKETNINGFNITVPYKEKILDYLDVIDESAKQIGAVNTVHSENGKWIGYNTDGIGFVRSLESAFPELVRDAAKRILILGAGGAAKGIYHGLLKQGYKDITIANRTIQNAKNITKQAHSAINLEKAQNDIGDFDIIIQTSSVGMKPNVDQSIISLTGVKSNAIVSDIVYQPIETSFLQEAKILGASIHFGHTMLLFQGQAAFEIWTGKKPNMQGLRTQLQALLEG